MQTIAARTGEVIISICIPHNYSTFVSTVHAWKEKSISTKCPSDQELASPSSSSTLRQRIGSYYHGIIVVKSLGAEHRSAHAVEGDESHRSHIRCPTSFCVPRLLCNDILTNIKQKMISQTWVPFLYRTHKDSVPNNELPIIGSSLFGTESLCVRAILIQ